MSSIKCHAPQWCYSNHDDNVVLNVCLVEFEAKQHILEVVGEKKTLSSLVR